MKITKQMIMDFEATRDFWAWATESKEILQDKDTWPEYNRIKNIFCSCAFCQYICYCKKCPLNRCYENGYYIEWKDAKTLKQNHFYAKKIWEVTVKHLAGLKRKYARQNNKRIKK